MRSRRSSRGAHAAEVARCAGFGWEASGGALAGCSGIGCVSRSTGRSPARPGGHGRRRVAVHHPIAPQRLRHVDPAVRCDQQRVQAGELVGAGDADGHRQPYRLALDFERALAHRVAGGLCGAPHVVLGGALQDRAEFLAAVAAGLVVRPERGAQRGRDVRQHPIADLVPEPVVDQLEAVDVDHQQPGDQARRAAVGEHLARTLEEQPARGQAGQLVGARQRAKLRRDAAVDQRHQHHRQRHRRQHEQREHRRLQRALDILPAGRSADARDQDRPDPDRVHDHERRRQCDRGQHGRRRVPAQSSEKQRHHQRRAAALDRRGGQQSQAVVVRRSAQPELEAEDRRDRGRGEPGQRAHVAQAAGGLVQHDESAGSQRVGQRVGHQVRDPAAQRQPQHRQPDAGEPEGAPDDAGLRRPVQPARGDHGDRAHEAGHRSDQEQGARVERAAHPARLYERRAAPRGAAMAVARPPTCGVARPTKAGEPVFRAGVSRRPEPAPRLSARPPPCGSGPASGSG